MPIINPIDSAIKGHHNYYHPDEFFRRDEAQGAIYLRDGQRAAKVSEDFITGLHAGLDEEVGDASNLIMYKCGYEWALQDMRRFNDGMRKDYGGGKLDIWAMNQRFVFEAWWWPMSVQGYGGWSLDLSFKKKNITFIEIRNSAVAFSMKRVGKPVCHLYAGLFAGTLSFYEREERQCIEVQCYSMGNDCCKFMIGPEKQVNAAEFWRQEGASADEIQRNFE